MTEITDQIPYMLVSTKNLSIINTSSNFLSIVNLGVEIINKNINFIFEPNFLNEIKEFISSEIDEKFTVCRLKNNSRSIITNIKKIFVDQNKFILLTFIPLKNNVIENLFTNKYYNFTNILNIVSFSEHVHQLLESNNIAILTIKINNTGELIKTFGVNGFFDIWKVITKRIDLLINRNIVCGCFCENIFLFCLEHNSSDEDTLIFIHTEILPVFEKTIIIKDKNLKLSTSCCLVFSQKDNDSADDLIANSLIAVSNSRSKTDTVLFYCPQKYKSPINAINLKNDILNAINKEELTLHYQPYYCINSGMIKGAEALIRWIKNGEIIPPMNFIPYLEESDLILIVEEWMVDKVAKIAQILKKLNLKLTISLNISPNSFNQRSFYEYLLYKITKEYKVEDYIILEITERMIIEDISTTKYVINKLRDNGIKISIDDFGTGNSSLMNITKISADFLKIDMNITQKLLVDEKIENVLKYIILMAHSLNTKVIAEGVENLLMVQKLKNISCDYGQGYFWSKPIDEFSFLQIAESHYVKS